MHDARPHEIRVLLLDGDPVYRALSRREIGLVAPSAAITEVDHARGLDGALEDGPFDLAVIDGSPVWSDIPGVLDHLRAAEPTVSAIIYTSAAEDRALEAMKSGFDDYVVKGPAGGLRLRAAMEAALARVKERRTARQAQARYETLFEAVSVGVFACHGDGGFVEGNPALEALLGVEGEELTRLNLLDLVQTEGFSERWRGLTAVRGEEVSLLSPGGRRLQVLIDAYARPDGVDGLMTDVTALREAVRQKDMLLREVFHRVYNNLQQVEALLNLQGRRFEDPQIRRAFKDVGDRLRSLALIQRKLYQGDDYERIDFSGYLRDLATDVGVTAGRPDVQIVVEAEPIFIDVEKAAPLGMIANELLSNAMKHAFVDGRGGRVEVSLSLTGERRLRLEVRDDGAGADPAVVAAGRGLGSRLIPSLTKQLNADFAVENVGGVRATLVATI